MKVKKEEAASTLGAWDLNWKSSTGAQPVAIVH